MKKQIRTKKTSFTMTMQAASPTLMIWTKKRKRTIWTKKKKKSTLITKRKY
ncbi:MAG: hypothetical protein LBD79_04120 [Treponema sp.]|nr:hypothetical protein [Treponema sp.]